MQQPIYQPPIYQSSVYQPQPPVIYQLLQSQIIYQTPAVQTLLSNSAQMTSENPRSRNSGTGQPQNQNSQHYLSLLVNPENAVPNNPEYNQNKSLTSNIPPATSTENESLAAIFLFDLDEITSVLLFSRAALNTKPIMAMYTNTKVDGQSIKLILDSHRVDHAISTRIIMADGATKPPISKIDNFPFEVNGLIIPIKVLVMEVT
ncbi:hypothetical protein G9A89_005549 [Geosiphon pyriformis]|nr:hypothetical protein G9A89_005549 [Geosiphon pyriformis]